jgi:hypothetical protein
VAVLFATVRAPGGRLHGYDTAFMSTYVSQPASVWSRPLKLVFGFFFPMAFTA